MAAHCREITTHKYYKEAEGLRAKLEEILIQDKRKAPGRIPYYFSCSKPLPGKFMLGEYVKDSGMLLCNIHILTNTAGVMSFLSVCPSICLSKNITFRS